jgi:neutral ceramidase
MSLTAGTAAVVITPPIGTPMDGYSARGDVSQGVHDDLHARALVIDDGSAAFALVSCDLVGVDRRLVADVRERASEPTGIPPERILVAATHTHAGPAGLRQEIDEALVEVTARHIAGAIVAAYRARRPAVLKVGTSHVDSVSQNRRDPHWPIDPALLVLLFDDPDPLRTPIAAVINFGCHATVLYQTNLLLSADYPGTAVRTVEQVFPGLGGVFLNGACANVNPAWIEQEFREAERVGKVVGTAAARLIAELRPLGPGQRAHNIRWNEHPEKPVTAGELIPDVRLRVATRRTDLPVRAFMAPEEYERSLQDLEAQMQALGDSPDPAERRRLMEKVTRLRTERTVAERMAGQEGRMLHPEVMAISFAPDLSLLGLPGEFFVETVAEIRGRAGVRYLPVACYANHYIGYVVPPAAYDEGGYEAGVSLLASEAEGILKTEALALLREVAAGA